MQRSTDRIYTTHVGSLARPAPLLDLMKAAAEGEPVQRELAAAQRAAVADAVEWQRAAGIDVINDGEQGKTGFFAYIGQRLSGFEPRHDRGALDNFRAEIDAFPEYYEQYFTRAMTGGMAVPIVSVACTGPVSYTGQEQIGRDLAALRAAVGDAGPDEVFVCAVAPSGVGDNEYYRSETDYLDAVADALRVEYAAIVDAGFTLQIDDPFLTDVFSYGAGSLDEKVDTAQLYVDAINRSLEGIPRERVRLHTCYGINEGPRVHDAPLAELIETLLTIEAGRSPSRRPTRGTSTPSTCSRRSSCRRTRCCCRASSATPPASSSTPTRSPTASSGSPTWSAGRTSWPAPTAASPPRRPTCRRSTRRSCRRSSRRSPRAPAAPPPACGAADQRR
jgi:5-methyltetrahydropteroyltriglutamate--homocysteine methyltransferase